MQRTNVGSRIFTISIHSSTIQGNWVNYQQQNITALLYPSIAHLLEVSHHIATIRLMTPRVDTDLESLIACEYSYRRVLQHAMARANGVDWDAVRGLTPPALRIGGGGDLLDSNAIAHILKSNNDYIKLYGLHRTDKSKPKPTKPANQSKKWGLQKETTYA